jgi:5'/3'-nucleotidase
MRILLTNDDGIRAPGIAAMHEALLGVRWPAPAAERRATHEATQILTIAPLTVQSATGHGVTFKEPLMVREEAVREGVMGLAVDGRPADCVKLAISSLWPERFGKGLDGKPSRPDLLISGMNAGANCGINVIYSGTVAAAIESAFLGVPSIAVSLHIGPGKPRFEVAARHAATVIGLLVAGGLPAPHECLSINIPVMQEDGPLPPIRVCPMNTHGLVDTYERRVSPAGDVYYWATGHGLDFHQTEPGSDVDALLARNITVTPLMYDLTQHGALEGWRRRLG